MAKAIKDLKLELQRVHRNAGDRRQTLLGMAIYRSKLKRRLTIFSGILALLSATAITTVLIKWVGNEGLQIVAASTAAISGIMSLLITTYQDEETQKIFSGASAYLALRDQVNSTLLNPDLTSTLLYNMILEHQKEYADLDHVYARYFPRATLSSRHTMQSDPYGYEPPEVSLFGRIMIAILPETRESRVPSIFLKRRSGRRR